MRKQCAKCPWRKNVDPTQIPNGYDPKAHAALQRTIAEPGDLRGSGAMMACHETPVGAEKPCVGWLAHQLGPGNNLGLRLRVTSDRELGLFELVGEQHERFEDTLPKRRRKAARLLARS